MPLKQVNTPLVAYKGFDNDLKCRGFQYEIGMTYHHEGPVVRCAAGGFHACLSPLDVLSYYNPTDSRFCLVEVSGLVDTDDEDTKVAAGTIRVVRELTPHEMCAAAAAYVAANGDHKSNMGNDSTASVEGVASVAMASGTQGRAKAARGSAIVLCHRADDGALMHIKAGIAGIDVKPDTWYVLSAEGEFEEWVG